MHRFFQTCLAHLNAVTTCVTTCNIRLRHCAKVVNDVSNVSAYSVRTLQGIATTRVASVTKGHVCPENCRMSLKSTPTTPENHTVSIAVLRKQSLRRILLVALLSEIGNLGDKSEKTQNWRGKRQSKKR